MIVRRLLAGVLLTALAVPALAAAPRGNQPKSPPQVVAGMGTRVFARADGSGPVAQVSPAATPSGMPSPSPAASPSPSASPVAGPTPASLGAARTEYEAWRSGKIDRSRYTAQANAAFTEVVIAQVSAGLTQAGAIQDFTQAARTEPQPGVTLYVYRVRAALANVEMQLAVDAAGKYAGIVFRPAQP